MAIQDRWFEIPRMGLSELDHLFILVRDDSASGGNGSKTRAARLSGALREAGLNEAFSRVHSGQGTANHRFQFDNVMVELLYIHDRAELSVPPTTALRLKERFDQADASPFGICSRPDGSVQDSGQSNAPFVHALYKPSYLPSHLEVQYADEPPASEPLWFHLPFARAPEAVETTESTDTADTMDAVDALSRQHPSGLRRVSGVRLEVRHELSPLSASIAEQLQIQIVHSERDHMHLHFDPPLQAGKYAHIDPEPQGKITQLDPHPELPLTLHW